MPKDIIILREGFPGQEGNIWWWCIVHRTFLVQLWWLWLPFPVGIQQTCSWTASSSTRILTLSSIEEHFSTNNQHNCCRVHCRHLCCSLCCFVVLFVVFVLLQRWFSLVAVAPIVVIVCQLFTLLLHYVHCLHCF